MPYMASKRQLRDAQRKPSGEGEQPNADEPQKELLAPIVQPDLRKEVKIVMQEVADPSRRDEQKQTQSRPPQHHCQIQESDACKASNHDPNPSVRSKLAQGRRGRHA